GAHGNAPCAGPAPLTPHGDPPDTGPPLPRGRRLRRAHCHAPPTEGVMRATHVEPRRGGPTWPPRFGRRMVRHGRLALAHPHCDTRVERGRPRWASPTR